MEEEIMYNKIYARANADGIVVHIFSQAFETPLETDVCIDETNTDRHGAQKYPVMDENGIFNYEVKNGVFQERDKTADYTNLAADELRSRRETECFAVINRGLLWYEKLTQVQKQELSEWYEAWLDAPATGTAPTAPVWLNEVAGQAKTI